MSEIQTSHDIENVRNEFSKLLKNLSEVLKETRPRTDIRSTKLWKIKEDLEKIESLDCESMAKVAELVAKYNSINHIFENSITYNKHDLSKIIEGARNYQKDTNEEYNNYFFELSMGVRLFLALKHKETIAKVNLDGACDVIINDEIAIECKYIHSPSSLVKNIKKAKEQIEVRVSENQAKYGIVALDLSHICPREKVNIFAKLVLDEFIEMYETMESRGRIDGSLLENIIRDRNFSKIIGNFIMSQVETSLYCELGFSYDLGENTKAIIFQSLNSFAFEYKGNKVPMTTRGMTYFINKNLSRESTLDTQKFIHSLAVGV